MTNLHQDRQGRPIMSLRRDDQLKSLCDSSGDSSHTVQVEVRGVVSRWFPYLETYSPHMSRKPIVGRKNSPGTEGVRLPIYKIYIRYRLR